jgi:MFS family permease
VSWGSDKLQKRKRFVWPPLLIASIAFYGSYALGAEHFWWSYTLLVIAGACMYAPYGPFFAIVPEILPANVAGGAMALINSMGALGSFGGSYLVGYLNSSTGSPGASYLLMSGALLLSVVLTIFSSPAPVIVSWPKPLPRVPCRCIPERFLPMKKQVVLYKKLSPR